MFGGPLLLHVGGSRTGRQYFSMQGKSNWKT